MAPKNAIYCRYLYFNNQASHIWYLQVAAATDRRHLRIFSTGGMQREVLSLPGPIVAMSGFHDKLMVSVHIGMPLPGNQCIGNF